MNYMIDLDFLMRELANVGANAKVLVLCDFKYKTNVLQEYEMLKGQISPKVLCNWTVSFVSLDDLYGTFHAKVCD